MTAYEENCFLLDAHPFRIGQFYRVRISQPAP